MVKDAVARRQHWISEREDGKKEARKPHHDFFPIPDLDVVQVLGICFDFLILSVDIFSPRAVTCYPNHLCPGFMGVKEGGLPYRLVSSAIPLSLVRKCAHLMSDLLMLIG